MTGPNGGWVTVRVSAGAHASEMAAALFHAGAEGLQELGETLVAYVRSQSRAAALASAARAVDAAAHVETEPLADVDWSREWRRGVRAHQVGALTIAPPWLAAELDPAASIVIDPGMAFGTGEHPTTRGVVRLMQRVVRPGDRVADLGAGSAVLAIAAAKIGAASIAAIEIDGDAIGNAEANLDRNGVADRVRVIEGDAALLLPLVAPVELVTANIISSVLLELLPVMARSLAGGGHAILAGMLVEERESVSAAAASSGWRIDAEEVEDAWWSATLSRA